MAALATVYELAGWLGVPIDDTADVVRAESLLNSLSGMARRVARQTFDQVIDDAADLTGTWQPTLDLPEKPVTSVTSVTIDGTAIDADTYELLPPGQLYRAGTTVTDTKHLDAGTWGGPYAKVTVTYTHGWSEVPADVKGVVLAAAARAWNNPHGLTSERIDDYQATYQRDGGTFTRYEVDLLRSYRPTVRP